ncbi:MULTISPECIES: low molecular weight protein-tyrosine-phosphatase [unclassified Virgibacillus]|uniref:low molecular weight protein-tyrosine-phosphatase n=1 Tax=unclassified Virgibacillus TaxID=2620237 RepID=UPI0024DE7D88|nr:low molecular weight protein-tyrosine-phosphatase [Virgibacillus sp. LDC-1]
MIRVLFVCLGNICRSPMAEAVFRQMVKEEKLETEIEVDSSGTGDWHVGEPPHHGTRDLLAQKQIPYDGLRARQVTVHDWEKFDYIIAMDDQNIKDLRKLKAGNDNIVVAKLMDYVQNAGESNVPDPYFTGDFDYTYKLVKAGCANLLTYIKVVNGL